MLWNPWGVETEDLRTGIIASTIANVNRDPKKQKKPFKTPGLYTEMGKTAAQRAKRAAERRGSKNEY